VARTIERTALGFVEAGAAAAGFVSSIPQGVESTVATVQRLPGNVEKMTKSAQETQVRVSSTVDSTAHGASGLASEMMSFANQVGTLANQAGGAAGASWDHFLADLQPKTPPPALTPTPDLMEVLMGESAAMKLRSDFQREVRAGVSRSSQQAVLLARAAEKGQSFKDTTGAASLPLAAPSGPFPGGRQGQGVGMQSSADGKEAVAEDGSSWLRL